MEWSSTGTSLNPMLKFGKAWPVSPTTVTLCFLGKNRQAFYSWVLLISNASAKVGFGIEDVANDTDVASIRAI